MEIIILSAVIVFLMTLLIVQQVLNTKEKKDLLNRLMSKDFTDYAGNTAYLNSKNQQPQKAVEETLDRLLRQEAENYLPVGS